MELRAYQQEDVDFFVKQRRGMILYEMRLGKTVVACELISRLQPSKVLIVCPQNALFVWKDHIEEWVHRRLDKPVDIRIFAPTLTAGGNTRGDYAVDRMLRWQKPTIEGHQTFYICMYGSFLRDIVLIKKHIPNLGMIILDEAKRLRSRQSKTFKEVEALARKIPAVYFLEGTPTSRGPKDFWTMFHICNRTEFTSYWKFVNDYHIISKGVWGQQLIGEPKNREKWLGILKRYTRIRYRKDVRPQMPSVQRQVIRVEMTDEQRSIYKKLDHTKIAFTPEGELILANTSMEELLRLRQLLICPKVLASDLGMGAAVEALVEKLEETTNDVDRHVVIYCPFKQPLEVISRYLKERLGSNTTTELLHGGIGPQEQQQRIRRFLESRGIMLCTIRYAEAFSLAPATASYFIGSEYDPNTNRQAEDRLIPQEGSNPIYAGYFAYTGTVDEKVVMRIVDYKQRIIDQTMPS